MKRALITGITGQDGSYLAEHLLSLGYEVHGLVRQTGLEQIRSNTLSGVTADLYEQCLLHPVSLDNFPGLYRLISKVEFTECYHLAASSFVGERIADGFQTMHNNISGAHYLMASLYEFQPKCRVYLAGSSEMFGRPDTWPQNESTPLMPRNPYGISKVAAHHLMRSYREAHGMFCSTGFLYNHESPRRRPEFVTRKITMAAAKIKAGRLQHLELGNLEAERDWGYAPDYVKAMHAILNHDVPDDFVVATGVLHKVSRLCEIAFSHAGLNWQDHVKVNPIFYRTENATPLVGDPSKIKQTLGWEPSTTFEKMIGEMVEADLNRN
jgi:GDPmannose 4,6-dehydratase